LKDAEYGIVIVDPATSLGVLHVSPPMASDRVLIPAKLDAMAVDGVDEVLRSMGEVVERGHWLGYSILPTRSDRTTRETVVQLQALIEAPKERIWPPIPQGTKAREAPVFGKSLWEYCPQSPDGVGFNDQRASGYVSTLSRLIESL